MHCLWLFDNNLESVWVLITQLNRAFTGGIEKFLAKENFSKILKVSHFCLGFFPNKTIMKFKHSRIEKFSAKENLRKILKVSHFCLGFFLNKTIMQLNILKGFH